MLYQLKIPESPLWEEMKGRALHANVLINDNTGKLETMCRDDRGQDTQFGPEVIELANKFET